MYAFLKSSFNGVRAWYAIIFYFIFLNPQKFFTTYDKKRLAFISTGKHNLRNTAYLTHS